MKLSIKIVSASLLFVMMLLLTGCPETDGVVSLTDDNSATKQNLELKKAWEDIAKFELKKQTALLKAFRFFHNNYENQFLESDLTGAQLDSVYLAFEALIEDEMTVKNAEDIILGATPIINTGKSSKYDKTQSPKQSWTAWFSTFSQKNQDARKELIEKSKNLPQAKKNEIFNYLRDGNFQNTTSGYDATTFWDGLEKGHFDNNILRMKKDLMLDFEDDFNKNYGTNPTYVAADDALGLAKEGLETVISNAKYIPTPLTIGIGYAYEANKFAEKMELLYKDPYKFLSTEIADKIKEKLTPDLFPDGFWQDKYADLMGKYYENLAVTAQGYLDKLNVLKFDDWGLAKILDTDENNSELDIVIAECLDEDAVSDYFISIGSEIIDGYSQTELGLPAGNWKITSFDKEGYFDEVISNIVKSIATLILTSTDEDGDHQLGEYSLSIWISPANPADGQTVTAYAKIYPAKSGVEIYFSVVGTDGYAKEETEATNSSGEVSFTVPGASSGVKDRLTFRIVETGLTRELNYTFGG